MVNSLWGKTLYPLIPCLSHLRFSQTLKRIQSPLYGRKTEAVLVLQSVNSRLATHQSGIYDPHLKQRINLIRFTVITLTTPARRTSIDGHQHGFSYAARLHWSSSFVDYAGPPINLHQTSMHQSRPVKPFIWLNIQNASHDLNTLLLRMFFVL